VNATHESHAMVLLVLVRMKMNTASMPDADCCLCNMKYSNATLKIKQSPQEIPKNESDSIITLTLDDVNALWV
jgi:hypothetical protein